jgi:hypothetical protein
MSDNETDDDDGVFLDLLADRFSPFDEVLANVRKHRTVHQFRKFAEMGLSTLKPNEIDIRRLMKMLFHGTSFMRILCRV